MSFIASSLFGSAGLCSHLSFICQCRHLNLFDIIEYFRRQAYLARRLARTSGVGYCIWNIYRMPSDHFFYSSVMLLP